MTSCLSLNGESLISSKSLCSVKECTEVVILQFAPHWERSAHYSSLICHQLIVEMYLSIHFLLVCLRYLQLNYVLYGIVTHSQLQTHRTNSINIYFFVRVCDHFGCTPNWKEESKHFIRVSHLPLVFSSFINYSQSIIFFTNHIGRESQTKKGIFLFPW